ncbi:PIPK domain-containing protein, variant 3 [Balamuthia mandrillaris]
MLFSSLFLAFFAFFLFRLLFSVLSLSLSLSHSLSLTLTLTLTLFSLLCHNQFFGLGSISWNAVISLNLIINLRHPFVDTSKGSLIYHLYVWSLCTITTALMLGFKQWGVSGDGTCWIKGTTNPWRLVFYLPLVIYFILAGCAFIIGLFSVRYMKGESIDTRYRMVIRMFFYVAVFILCWSGPVIHKTAEYWGNESEGLIYFDGIGASVQGFANALVWLTNPSFYSNFRKYMKRIDRRGWLFRGEDAHLPLLGEEGNKYLSDTKNDMSKVDAIMRKNVITFLLNCMKNGCERVRSDVPLTLTEADFNEDIELRQMEEQQKSQLLTNFRFVDYSPLVFQELRRLDGITPQHYMNSLDPETFLASLDSQKFSEGRSGSFFCFSPDKCFIIKTISRSEAKLLVSILPDLYRYMANNPDSLLMRFYGCHCIRMHYGDSIYAIVIGNSFNTDKKMHERYDLKGSWVRREVGKAHMENPSVLGMDLDLQRMGRKVIVAPELRHKLLQQLISDAQFLTSLNIMDYSILLGYHFTWKAKEESEFEYHSASDDEELEEEQEDADREINEAIVIPGGTPNTMGEELHNLKVSPRRRTYPSPQSRGGSSSGKAHRPKRTSKSVPSLDGNEEYFISIIDTLQAYDWNKKIERWLKVWIFRKDMNGVSVQPPPKYGARFIDFADKLILSGSGGGSEDIFHSVNGNASNAV